MKDFLGVGRQRIASKRMRSSRLVNEKKPRKDRKKLLLERESLDFQNKTITVELCLKRRHSNKKETDEKKIVLEFWNVTPKVTYKEIALKYGNYD